MSTTSALDHYRLSVVSNRTLFHVLSNVYKYDSEWEEVLQENIGIPHHDLRGSLTALYRANLVREDPARKWKITPLAEEILSRLQISETVSRSFISEESLDDLDMVFLSTCLSAFQIRDVTWSRDITSLLREMKTVLAIVGHAEPIEKQEKTRALYALIVGSNQSAASVDIRTYCDSIFDYSATHVAAHSNLSNFAGSKNTIYDRCSAALLDMKSSNNLFVTNNYRIAKVDVLITLTRLLANLRSRRDVTNLRYLYLMNNDAFKLGVDEIIMWRPSIKKYISDHCSSSFGFIPEDMRGKTLQLKLVENLINTFEKPSPELRTCRVNDIFEQSDDHYNATIFYVTTLRHAIVNGDPDALTLEQKRAIMSELNSTLRTAKHYLSIESAKITHKK